MNHFEVGDLVVCVDQPHTGEWGAEFISVGSKYRVRAITPSAVMLDSRDPVQRWWPYRMFSMFDRPEKTSLKPPLADAILQPHHYSRFVIEPITFILANRLPFNIGNVVKYACRYDAKNGVEDLKKAKRYLDIQIEMLEREERIKNGEDARDVWKVMI